MSTEIPRNCWAFVIDTDKYAGNFERELCAYCTGITGDCNVGENLIPSFEKFMRKLKWKVNKFTYEIAFESDDGCYRPVTIYPSLDKKDEPYSSVAIFFRNKPSKILINIMKDRAKEFCSNPNVRITNKTNEKEFCDSEQIKIKGYRIIQNHSFDETKDVLNNS